MSAGIEFKNFKKIVDRKTRLDLWTKISDNAYWRSLLVIWRLMSV